jgi:hypothetical protein
MTTDLPTRGTSDAENLQPHLLSDLLLKEFLGLLFEDRVYPCLIDMK